jgi:hypothetical protein
MVTRTQRREIEKLMRRIKQAKDNNADNRVIKERTQDLYNYLEREGIIMR